jgi:signal transduction histidine kinase
MKTQKFPWLLHAKLLEHLETQIQAISSQEQSIQIQQTQFIATASHELRTPMAVIMSSTGILQHFGDQLGSARKQEHWQQIQAAIQAIVRQLDDLLVLDQLRYDQLAYRPQHINLFDWATHWLDTQAPLLGRHKVSLSAVSDQHLGLVDSAAIAKILTYLLANATQYSAPDSDIVISYQVKREQICFKVQDTGWGIPKSEQAYVFRPFYRAANVGDTHGLGLGLAIAKQLSQSQGGYLQLDSEVNQGTCMSLILPQLYG